MVVFARAPQSAHGTTTTNNSRSIHGKCNDRGALFGTIKARLIGSYLALALLVVVVSVMGIGNLAVSQRNFEHQVTVIAKEDALLVTLFDAVNARAVAARISC